MTRTNDIYDMPFSYVVNGVLKGSRKSQPHPLVDTVPIEIPQVSGADAPVAARARSTATGEIVIEHRAWSGRPIAPMKQSVHNASTTIGPEDLSDLLRRMPDSNVKWEGYPLNLPPGMFGAVAIAPYLADHHEFRSIESSSLEAKRSEAQAMLGGCVFVDGVLHSPVPELRWCTTPGKDVSRLSLSTSSDGHESFRADRLEDARRFISFFRSARKVRSHDLEDMGLLDWKYDAAQASMERCARSLVSVLEGGVGSTLIRLPKDLLVLLPDIVEAARTLPPASEFLSLIERVRASVEAPVGTLDVAIRRTVAAPALRYRRIDGIASSTDADVAMLAGLDLGPAP